MDGDLPDLTGAKLRFEVEKLTQEVAKLREDRRWYNRHLAVVGAICGVLATFAVGFAQFSTTAERNRGDLDRAAREDHRRDVETGLRLLQFAAERGSDMLSGDPDRQSRFIRMTRAMLPEAEAQRMLEALGAVVTQAPVLAQLAALGAPVTLAARPQPAPDTSAPAPAPATLRVFAHIADEQDRLAARGFAANLGPNLPLAGVELVPGWAARRPTVGDVRYYKPAQAETARALAARLAEATHQRFEVRDLSALYPNLPADRIEVWFPVLP